MEEDFMHLQHGVRSIQANSVEFNKKARFARHQVDTGERHIDHYLWGLRTRV